MIRAYLAQLRRHPAALTIGYGAAWMEHATRWRIQRAGYLSGQQHPLALGVQYWIRNRHGREQGLGVGMLGVAVDLVPVCDFHYVPQIHHAHPVADMADHGQVVSYEEVR